MPLPNIANILFLTMCYASGGHVIKRQERLQQYHFTHLGIHVPNLILHYIYIYIWQIYNPTPKRRRWVNLVFWHGFRSVWKWCLYFHPFVGLLGKVARHILVQLTNQPTSWMRSVEKVIVASSINMFTKPTVGAYSELFKYSIKYHSFWNV
jgi:hypothetical protein